MADTDNKQIGKALLLIGSAKPEGQSTSEMLGTYLLDQLVRHGYRGETYFVHRALRTPQRTQELLAALDQSDLFTLAFPLYVDSLPYLVTEALERIAAHRRAQPTPAATRFVAIANCGFPEAQHNATALAICHAFARQTGMNWAGGLALGQGGAIAGRPLTAISGMARHAITALDLTATALCRGQPVPEEAVALMAKPLMPPFFYTMMGNMGWRLEAHRQGALGHLRDQPFAATASHPVE
ncbi:MAG: hypothetical protein KDE47_18375 [Caldilineaceae bacterium]|nr:hypothetical protein [Caldilineaceae bacterium]